MARSTGTLWPVHNGVQSVQSLVAAWHLETNLRHVGREIARQPISDRQHDRESPPCGQRGKRGEQNQAIGISRGGRSTKIHAIVDSKGRPLNFAVTGGQVHDSQVVGDVLDTPKPPLAITADKAYDSEKVRQQIKDEGALPIIPSRSNATIASRTGGVSRRATTSLPETFWLPRRLSVHSIGSSCESRR